nr:hypothetical protein [Mycoplasmopsis bovis]
MKTRFYSMEIGRFNKDPETFRVIAIPIMYAEWRSSKSLTIFLSW